MKNWIRKHTFALGAAGLAAAVFFGAAGVAIWSGDGTLPAGADLGVAGAIEREYERAAPLPRELNAHIREQIAKMTSARGRTATLTAFERSRPMIDHAERVFAEYGLPPELIHLAHVESHWRNAAVSHAAAAGVWQFIPKTAVRFGLKVEEGADERFDYEKETVAAAQYLRFLHDYYDGNWPIAIAAYNCGEERMDAAIAANGGKADFWELVEKKLLPRETREYTPKVLAAGLVANNRTLLAPARQNVAKKDVAPSKKNGARPADVRAD